MNKAMRTVGWICFVIALAVYLIATFYFGSAFASAIAQYKAGETVDFAVVLLVFIVIGSIIYAVDAVISIIGAIVANVKRGERKLFFAPLITLALSVLTWIIFLLLGSTL